ncbi:HNH endonuclease [Burkholderia multivorans]|uniref:HNH endonuclease n=1 Tax=Burkholderia multivorans TaxID=87883 RepID=UPI0021C0028A|nr:HNH endonuclease [Burkholderia multivorans]
MSADPKIRQLAALRRVALHVGLIAPIEAHRPDREEIARRVRTYGIAPFVDAIAILLDKDASSFRKTAALGLAEMFMPDIRDRIAPELLGPVLQRRDREVVKWRRAVLMRDGHQCVRCGHGQELHAHHIARWADAPHLRTSVDNGETLCRKCHEQEHHPQPEAQAA